MWELIAMYEEMLIEIISVGDDFPANIAVDWFDVIMFQFNVHDQLRPIETNIPT